MSTKTITLAEDAYDQLLLLKQGKESFSDVVRRMTAPKPLSSFAGILTREDAERVKGAIVAGRAKSRQRAKAIRKALA